MNDALVTLRSLIPSSFNPLTEAEDKLIAAIETNSGNHSRLAEPLLRNDANRWQKNRNVRASLIHWLCTDSRAQTYVGHHGVSLREVRIIESLDLTHAEIPFPVRLMRCHIRHTLLLCNCKLPFLRLTGSRTKSIIADGFRVDDLVDFSGLNIDGELTFRNARIGGILRLSNTKIAPSNRSARALEAYQAKINGTIFMEKLEVVGCLSLVGMRVDGDVRCHGAILNNEGALALNAYGLTVNGSIYLTSLLKAPQPSKLASPELHVLSPFQAVGEVSLVGATVKGVIECDGGTFSNVNGIAINATCLLARGLFLRHGFSARGSVSLLGARLSDNLECQGGTFFNSEHEAIRADGIRVDGHVFLKDGFRAEGEVSLKRAQVAGSVVCDSGRFLNPGGTAIHANEVNVAGDLLLRDNYEVQGQVSLEHANIKGSLELHSGKLDHPGHIALNAPGMAVGGYVCFKDRLEILGGVSFKGATITGAVECEEVTINHPQEKAFDGTALHAQSLFFRNGSCIAGEVRFLRAHFAGGIEFTGGQFHNSEMIAICASGITAQGSMVFRDTHIDGMIQLMGASIGSNVEIHNAVFHGATNTAIDAEHIHVKGHILLRAAVSVRGLFQLANSSIGGDLDCRKAHFSCHASLALSCDGIHIGGNLRCSDGFSIEGCISLIQAKVDRDFDCSDGIFSCPEDIVVNATGIVVGGSVLLTGRFCATGTLLFRSATIGLDIDCRDGHFKRGTQNEVTFDGSSIAVKGNVRMASHFRADGLISLNGAHIGGKFIWKDVGNVASATLDLRGAKAGQLDDDLNSWNLTYYLSRFTYDVLSTDEVRVHSGENKLTQPSKDRVAWLKGSECNKDHSVAPMPYDQLADVYMRMGHEDKARDIRIQKEEQRHTSFPVILWNNLKRRILQLIPDAFMRLAKLIGPLMSWITGMFAEWIGYGFKPFQPIRLLALFVLSGCCIFYAADYLGVMVPTKERVYMETGYKTQGNSFLGDTKYPVFDPLVYSIDTLIPFINLSQEDYWIPDARTQCGARVRAYLWMHIAAGWICCTFIIYGLANLVRKQ